jgi:site-specific DNA-cytosine methylase
MRERLLERYEIKEKKADERVGDARKPKQVASLILKSSKKGGRQGERVYSIDYPGVTVCCGSGGPGANTGLYDVDGAIRTLSVDEVLAMFGFPADYKRDAITEKKMINYLGNSICVPVLDALFGALLGHLIL